jgi:hypothetical protein
MAFDLGQMRRVGVRDVWKHEEQDFTPWLAQDGNFSRLRSSNFGEQVAHAGSPVGQIIFGNPNKIALVQPSRQK